MYKIADFSQHYGRGFKVRVKIYASNDDPTIKAILETDLSHCSHAVDFCLEGLYIEAEADSLEKAFENLREKLILFSELSAKPRAQIVMQAKEMAKSFVPEAANRIFEALGEVQ
ncbi:MAG: hypothetical protein QXS54_06955 [Candidatus Methanomethylicaceae archaeon]